MGIRTQQQVSKLVCHYMAQHPCQTDMPFLIQFLSRVVGNVGICSCSFRGKKRDAEDAVARFRRIRYDS